MYTMQYLIEINAFYKNFCKTRNFLKIFSVSNPDPELVVIIPDLAKYPVPPINIVFRVFTGTKAGRVP
jgi:hypothetical protein